MALIAHGYTPLPLFGKAPPEYGKNNQRGGLAGWTKLGDVSREHDQHVGQDLAGRAQHRLSDPATCRRSISTSSMKRPRVRSRTLARERFEERGWFLVRIGQAAETRDPVSHHHPVPQDHRQPDRTPTAARKSSNSCATASNSSSTASIPTRGNPIAGSAASHGGFGATNCPTSTSTKRSALIDDAATLLTTAFGYTRTAAAPKSKAAFAPATAAKRLWKFHLDNIRARPRPARFNHPTRRHADPQRHGNPAPPSTCSRHCWS